MSSLVTNLRRGLTALLVTLAMVTGLAAFAGPTASAQESAQESGPGSAVVGKSPAGKITSKVVGRASNGGKLSGKFTPVRVVKKKGQLGVKGFLQGVITERDGTKTRFSGIRTIPIKKVNGASLVDGRVASRALACDVLNLVLGPLDLNVLGLEVHLQRVVLDIIARTGAGQLLGNLLCAVAGLLDGGGLLSGLLGQLQTLLNQILGALNLGV
jgi:hypothetical protein